MFFNKKLKRRESQRYHALKNAMICYQDHDIDGAVFHLVNVEAANFGMIAVIDLGGPGLKTWEDFDNE